MTYREKRVLDLIDGLFLLALMAALFSVPITSVAWMAELDWRIEPVVE